MKAKSKEEIKMQTDQFILLDRAIGGDRQAFNVLIQVVPYFVTRNPNAILKNSYLFKLEYRCKCRNLSPI